MTKPVFNILYYLSAAAFLAVSCTNVPRSILWCVCTAGILFLLRKAPKIPFAHGKTPGLLSAFLTLLTAGTVVLNYGKLIKFTALFDALHAATGIGISLLQYAFAACCAAAGIYFLWVTIEAVLAAVITPAENTAAHCSSLSKKDWAVCLAVGFVTITLVSRSSPLYPMNDWMDPNCFFTVGKAMLADMMPYRDLYEQKGPLLYLLHALAAAISDTSYFGVYLLEIAAACSFLVLARKIMRLFRPNSSTLWVPVIAAVVYSAPAFVMGDSVEELCLPLLTYAMYLGLDIFRRDRELTATECLLIGITSGCVLWMKYSILGFYVGWFLAFSILRIAGKNIGSIFKTAGTIAVGVVLVSLPIVLLYLQKGALWDLWEAYFYNNLFLYSEAAEDALSSSNLYGLFTGYLSFARFNSLVMGLVVLGIFSSCPNNRQRLLLLCTAFMMFLLIYMGNRRYIYYSFVFASLLPVGLAALDSLTARPAVPSGKRLPLAVCAACLLLIFTQSENTAVLGRTKADLPQYQFAEIMNREENPTLLNYGVLDGGFYFAADITPTCRYFCGLNIPMPELGEAHAQYIRDGVTEFVVAHSPTLESDKYTCVAESSYWVEGEYRTYYLHQLKSEGN